MNRDFNLDKYNVLLQDSLNWKVSIHQINQFYQLQYLLEEWNKRVNLTRLLKGNDFWISQILDSLWPIRNDLQDQTNQKMEKKIIDVGSGCGLPGIAIAIALPKTSITLVDSIERKTNALKNIVKDLGLDSRINVINERVETLGQDIAYRNSFDISLARAVAISPIVAEYLIPLLNKNGEALIYKGKWDEKNLQELKNALIPLRGKINRIESMQLPEGRGERHIIRISQSSRCPKKYPRPIGVPSKKPLGY